MTTHLRKAQRERKLAELLHLTAKTISAMQKDVRYRSVLKVSVPWWEHRAQDVKELF